jgi:hypothetical protein
VVAADLHGLLRAREHTATVVLDARDLAVHQSSGTDDLAAEDLDDRLVTQADAEHRNTAREAADHVHRDTGIARRTRPGRDAQVRGRERLRFLDGDAVVAMHVHRRPRARGTPARGCR